jgi:FAM32A
MSFVGGKLKLKGGKDLPLPHGVKKKKKKQGMEVVEASETANPPKVRADNA